MPPLPQPRMTVPEFVVWAEAQDRGRCALIRGELGGMAPERAAASKAKFRGGTRVQRRSRALARRAKPFLRVLRSS